MAPPAPEPPAAERDQLRRLPKAELHIHLEGSMRPERMYALSHKNFGSAPWESPEAVADWFQYTDFSAFLEIYSRVCMCLQTPDDFRLLAIDYFATAAAQGVLYAELLISACLHHGRSIVLADIVAAVGEARDEAREQYGLESGLIFDLSRQLDPELGWEALREAIACRDAGVVGIGLGGNERDFPPELFANHFAAARSEGLGLCAHAGEWAGPDSMRGAMDILGATRLGHGTAVRHDASLLDELCARGVMLDMCPISNVRTKSIEHIHEHPIPACLDAGVPVSLNSDDPTLFQTSILGEYETLHQDFGVSVERLARIGPDAMAWSFADDATRSRVAARMQAALDGVVA